MLERNDVDGRRTQAYSGCKTKILSTSASLDQWRLLLFTFHKRLVREVSSTAMYPNLSESCVVVKVCALRCLSRVQYRHQIGISARMTSYSTLMSMREGPYWILIGSTRGPAQICSSLNDSIHRPTVTVGFNERYTGTRQSTSIYKSQPCGSRHVEVSTAYSNS